MVKKQGTQTSYEEIEQMFEFKTNQNNRIHSEVASKIKEIKGRNMTNQLEAQLKKLDLA